MATTPETNIQAVTARLHEIAHRDSATTVSVNAEDLRVLLNAASTSGAHQIELLGQALGACIVEAGITRPDAALTGPELLLFADDLRNEIVSLQQSQSSSNALIDFILSPGTESAMEYLRCWNEGNFDACRREWPEAPDAIYIGPDQFHPKTVGYGVDAAPAQRVNLKSDNPTSASGLGWIVRERRDSDGELRDCFVQAPAVAGMPYGLEVLGDDYTGYGDVQSKLEHCKLIVAWANAACTGAPTVRDDLSADGAHAQHKASAQALIRAIARTYPVGMELKAEIGGHVIQGEVIRHQDSWWSAPGEFTIRNVKTGKDRTITHRSVQNARASLALAEEAKA